VEDTLFIISSGAEDAGMVDLVHHVLHESSSAHPQLSNVRSVYVPVQRSKLQDWSGWLAVEVINQWLNLASTGLSVDDVIVKLGLSESEHKISSLITGLNAGAAGESLHSELSARVSLIHDQYSQLNISHAELQQWLEQKNVELSKWFSPLSRTSGPGTSPPTGLARVQFNAEALHIKTQLYFKEALVSWRQAGLSSMLLFLQALGERLTEMYARYDDQRKIYKTKEDSAGRAFNNLCTQLQQRSFLSKKRQVTFESALRGLEKVYSFKLEAEVYNQACQIVGKLRQSIHLLAVELVQTNDFLIRLRDELIQSSSSTPFFAPLLKQSLAQRLEPIKFRREIESVLGHPLNHWGKLRGAQESMLRQQILSQLNPICLEVYAQCYVEIMNLKAHNAQIKSIDKHQKTLNSITSENGSQNQENAGILQGQDIFQNSASGEQVRVQAKSEDRLTDLSHPSFVVDENFE
jgi:hypothetical protein